MTCLKEGLKHLSNVRVKVSYSCTFEVGKLWCFGWNKDQLRPIVWSVCLDKEPALSLEYLVSESYMSRGQWES